ncbi:MAG: pyridoxine 5'-phosphate synthase [Candidatus Sumerlaeia bacterium]
MTRLSVNLNKVAWLRNARQIGIPDVVKAAHTCIGAGAQGITVHPRPDGRHILRQDVLDLRRMVTVELNIEGYPSPEHIHLLAEVRPEQATLVPDEPGQLTSDHGWDLRAHGKRLQPIIRELKGLGCRVSLFMDHDSPDIERAAEVGADRVELYTEPYARAYATSRRGEVLQEYVRAAERAQRSGLDVNAGHDLNLWNLELFLRTVPDVKEVSIGHALISEALEMGLGPTVRRYLEVINRASF